MKLHFKQYGSGPPVIILHGLFGMGDNWQTVAKLLSTHFQCIVPDLRNHGRSPHADKMNFEVMAEDVMELMKSLDVVHSSFIGHSLGGKIAMQIALQYPEQTNALIIVDMAPKHYPPHHQNVIEAIQAINLAAYAQRSEIETAFRLFLGDDEATIQFVMKNLHRTSDGSFAWKANMNGIIRAYDKITEPIPEMRPFQGPTLFIRGGNSSYILDEDLLRIRELFPAAVLVTIPKAGHWVHADAPREFTDTVLAFFLNSSAVTARV